MLTSPDQDFASSWSECLLHPIAIGVEGVFLSVDGDGGVLRIPAGCISVPPAFGILLPGGPILVCPGTVGVQPPAIAP